MNTEELVAFFEKEASKYNSLPTNDRKFHHAILQSLPIEILTEVETALSEKEGIFGGLLSFIDWAKKEHSKKIEPLNESVTTLLKWYQNKNSKKVSYAYKQLVRRYDAQSFVDQKKILRAFLNGSKTSSEMAATKLKVVWIPELENDIAAAWWCFKGPKMARVIIDNMPESFVLQEQEELVIAAGQVDSASFLPGAYALLCGRLGCTSGFKMDESRLNPLDWFYVVSKLCLTDRIPDMDEKANQFIRNLTLNDYFIHDDSSELSLLNIWGMDRVLRAMKKLHHTDGIIRLYKLEQDAINIVNTSGIIENRSISFLYSLKSLVEDDLPEEQ